MQSEADGILRDTLTAYENRRIDGPSLTAFSIALEQFHNAVADRKALLAEAAGPPVRAPGRRRSKSRVSAPICRQNRPRSVIVFSSISHYIASQRVRVPGPCFGRACFLGTAPRVSGIGERFGAPARPAFAASR